MNRSVTLRLVGCLTAALVGTTRLAADPPQPASPGEAGRKAWDILDSVYQEKNGVEKELAAALAGLKTDNPAVSGSAADLLTALFRQAAADEENGRAEWRRLPTWGGGSESKAREFRKKLAARLEESGSTPAALPVALRLLREDRLPACLNAATKTVEECLAAEAEPAIHELLENGCHWRPALVMALRQAGKRGLRDANELVLRHSADPRESVRAAAAFALKELAAPAPPPFVPADAFHPPLVKFLGDVSRLPAESVPAHAKFGVLEMTQQNGAEKPWRESSTGWLLEEEDGVFRLLSWHGQTVEWGGSEKHGIKVSFTPADPAASAREIIGVRKGGDDANRERRLELLSSRGSLTGQFEPGIITTPEGLLAAWLFQTGDKQTAAELLFPALDRLDDDRWAFEILRDLTGHLCHQAMLDAFAFQRDHAATLRLAEHLSQPLFDGYSYQPRAKELATQLRRRTDDFRTHVLPEPAEWELLKTTMPRPAQIEFLAKRLRLLNCHQWSQPGGISYEEDQYRDVNVSLPAEPDQAKAVPVINPYQELRRLSLKPADISVLAPFLKDDDFLYAYSYWRDFHPSRTLHRVHWLIADLVNDAAMRTLIDLRGWQELDAAGRDQRVAEVTGWATTMAAKPEAEVIRMNMEQAPDAKEWLIAARAAAINRDPSLIGPLLAGIKKHAAEKATIAALCFRHGSPDALPAAIAWLKTKDPSQSLYGALIVIRHGKKADRENALAKLRAIMTGPWDEGVLVAAVEPVLSLHDKEATAAACKLLDRRELESSWTFGAVVHHLFLSDHPAALASLLKGLKSTSNPKTETVREGDKKMKRTHVRGDRVAEAVSGMRKGDDFPLQAPDKQRAKARSALADWLDAQAALRHAGNPTPELDTEPAPIRVATWQIDAP